MFAKLGEIANQTKAAKTQISNINLQADMLQLILVRLRMWSLLVLPLAGYIIGQILQYIFHTKVSCRYESLLVHGLTMVFMIATFNEILFSTHPEQVVTEIKERALFVCLSYLFVLGTVLGVIV
jgi:hypothetical protein